MMQTLQEIKKKVIQGKGDNCCVNEPLLDIDGVSKPSIQLIGRHRVKIFDKTSDWVEMIREIPQIPFLGPLLFNIFVNDLHFDLTNGEIKTFADDKQLYTCHQNADTVEDTLNSDLEIH